MVLCNGFKNCITPRTCNSKPLYKNHLDQKRFCNFSCISVEYCLVSKYNNQHCTSCNEPQRYIFQGNDSTFGLSFPHRGTFSERETRERKRWFSVLLLRPSSSCGSSKENNLSDSAFADSLPFFRSAKTWFSGN